MAIKNADKIMELVNGLTHDEKLELAQMLIERAKGIRPASSTKDINSFAGCLSLKEDALEIQHRLRSEWD